MPATDSTEVVFPPSTRPKMRKLVLRNTSPKVLVAKFKVVGAKEKEPGPCAVIPPNSCQHVILACLPNLMEDLKLDENDPNLYVALKENERLEIYCRQMFMDGNDNVVQKRHYKVHQESTKTSYRVTHTKMSTTSEQLSHLGKREQSMWWRERVIELARENPERLIELTKWAKSNIDHSEFLAYTLLVVRDAKRFAAPSILVEIPGNVNLVESVPFPVEKIDDSDCITAYNIASGTSTCMSFTRDNLMSMAASSSDCLTARQIGPNPCDCIARWLGWILPIKVE